MLLEMRAITKVFGPSRVLDAVDFTLSEGEIVALLGANGAGKSTLTKIITGVYHKDAGRMRIDGRDEDIRSPAQAAALGISILPQELQVVPDISVAENIFLGALPLRGRGALAPVDRRALHARARAVLATLGLGEGEIDVARRLGDYSVSKQRLVEIARALARKARILVLDEPTASLSSVETEQLFAILRRLKSQGVAVIFISHFLDEVFGICDRIEVLRDGRNAGSFRTAETDHAEVLRAMLGRDLTDLFPPRTGQAGETLFAVRGLSAPPRIADVGIEVRRGEIFGIFGLIGSGVEELGKLLCGARPAAAGEMRLSGRAFRPRGIAGAITEGVGFVSAERKTEGIVPDLPLYDNFTLPFLAAHSTGPVVRAASQRSFARRWISALDVRCSGPDQRIAALSGGNQQKVCIGRWLVDGLKLLILEEPTRGIDLGARKDIYAHLRRLASSGLTILALSTDAEEIAGISDRSVVLVGGRVAARFDGPADPHDLMVAATQAVRRAPAEPTPT